MWLRNTSRGRFARPFPSSHPFRRHQVALGPIQSPIAGFPFALGTLPSPAIEFTESRNLAICRVSVESHFSRLVLHRSMLSCALRSVGLLAPYHPEHASRDEDRGEEVTRRYTDSRTIFGRNRFVTRAVSSSRSQQAIAIAPLSAVHWKVFVRGR